jgi:hypothetical protein
LTGALNGTSAVFSSSVTAKGTLTIGESLVENGIINSPEGIYINADSDASGGTNDIVFGKGRTSTSGGTTFMTIKNGGNVGIGTDSPGFALDVHSGTAGSIINLNTTRVGGGGFAIANNGSARLYLGSANWMGVSGEGTGTTSVALGSAENSSIIFVTSAATTVNERMRITSGGNVGIGTTSPSARLEVNGNIYTTSNTNFILFGTNAALNPYVQGDTDNSLFIGNNNSAKITITSNGFVRLTASSGGIQFNGDTAAANALDDYEEGTWTPNTNGDATGTFNAAYGEYTKIGNFVFFRAVVSIETNFTGSSIAGLPFTVGGNATNSSLYGGMVVFNNSSSTLACTPSIGSTIIAFYFGSNISNPAGLSTSMQTLRISGAYRV